MKHLREILSQDITYAVEFDRNVLVYHDDSIIFMVSGELIQYTSSSVLVKQGGNRLLYNAFGQIIKMIPGNE